MSVTTLKTARGAAAIATESKPRAKPRAKPLTIAALFLQIAGTDKIHSEKITGLFSKLRARRVTEVDLKAARKATGQPEGRHYAALVAAVEATYFTALERQILAGERKPNKGELSRAELQRRRAPLVSKLRARYATFLKDAARKGKGKGKGKGARPGGTRSFEQVILTTCEGWAKRISANKDKDSFKFDADPIAVRAALVAVVKLLK